MRIKVASESTKMMLSTKMTTFMRLKKFIQRSIESLDDLTIVNSTDRRIRITTMLCRAKELLAEEIFINAIGHQCLRHIRLDNLRFFYYRILFLRFYFFN